MPSGTSVIGSQLVIEDQGLRLRWAYVVITGRDADPPSRVGYLYLVVRGGTRVSGAMIWDAGPLFSPGALLRIPDVLEFDEARWGIWVDWDEAGLPYVADSLAG